MVPNHPSSATSSHPTSSPHVRARHRAHNTTAREADAEHTHADIEKANDLIGYEPIRDIREFIDWSQANREWYEPLVRQS